LAAIAADGAGLEDFIRFGAGLCDVAFVAFLLALRVGARRAVAGFVFE